MIIATDDAQCLGALSSRTHVAWALAAGSTLEDRPRYIKSRCFEPFPFPTATADQQSRIRDLAEELDAHRKRQQAQHADLTLTGMYNVLEKLKSGEALTAKERKIHADGLVSVLKTLHDQIDLAVLDAYGWSDLAPLIEVVNGNATPGSGGTPASRDECKRTLGNRPSPPGSPAVGRGKGACRNCWTRWSPWTGRDLPRPVTQPCRRHSGALGQPPVHGVVSSNFLSS